MWVDALRVCREYVPVRLPELQLEYEQQLGSTAGPSDVSHLLAQAKEWEESGEYKTAVDCLLRVSLVLSSSIKNQFPYVQIDHIKFMVYASPI